MSDELLGRAQREARFEAAPFVVATTSVLVGLAALSAWRGWELVGDEDWWVWLVLAAPQALLAMALVSGLGGAAMAEHRRHVALWLIGMALAGSLAGVVLAVYSLAMSGAPPLGPQLLSIAFAVMLTNVVVFGLLFWELDCGGPVRRALAPARVAPDFQFPQDENPRLARAGWSPALLDYLYLALTNAIAFSPTDAMPLTRPAKLLMALEALVSITTIVVVAARAVSVLG